MTRTHFMKNYLLKMVQSLCITEVCKLWWPNFTKLKIDFRQKFLLKFWLFTESHYNVRRSNNWRIPAIRTVYRGSESISFLGPKIWNILPDEIKQQTSLNSFKKSVKEWKPHGCPCRLYKVYIDGVGFLS